MIAFNCLFLLGLFLHLVSSDVSLTIGSNKQANVRSEQGVRSNYEAPQSYEYSGSYSTVSPANNAQYDGSYSTVESLTRAPYVSSFSTGAPEIKYVGSYTSGADNKAQYVESKAAPENDAKYVGSYSSGNKAQYVSSYSTVAPENNAKFVGSYSTVAPENNAKYVGSYSTVAPENNAKYVGSYSTVAPENNAKYVGSYSTVAPESNAKYVGSYSTVAPENNAKYVGSYSSGNKAQYVGSYSTVAPENNAKYVGSYSTVAPENNAKYVGSYSTVAPESNAKYVGSYSTVAPENNAKYVDSYSSGNKAQYVGSYSTVAPENNAKYVGSYSTVAPENNAKYVGSYSSSNKAQYVGSYSPASATENNAKYVGSFSTVVPGTKGQYVGSYSSGNKAQYVSPSSSSSGSSYDSYPSGQVTPNRGYYSAKQEYSPQYQNDRGVQLISKELQVPFAATNEYQNEKSDGCDENDGRTVNQQVQGEETFNQNVQNNVAPDSQQVQGQDGQQVQGQDGQQVHTEETYDQNVQGNAGQGNVQSNVGQGNVQSNEGKSNVGQGNVQSNVGQDNQNVHSVESDDASTATPAVYKTSKYEVRRPGVRKEFYDIEERVVIRPAGHAIFELQHDKPHTSAIVDQHVNQQQSYPQYPQYADDDDSQYYPQEQQQFANHAYPHHHNGYNPVIIHSRPPNGYGYSPVVPQLPPRPHVPAYPSYPTYPSTTVTSGYLPPVPVIPPCEDAPKPPKPSKPHPPSSHHELSDEYEEDGHDYDSDAGFITPNEESQSGDIRYAQSKSSANRDREYYRPTQPSAYNPDLRIDRLRVEYQNQRGDLAQLKANQNPQQFHQEYVPNGYVDQKQVQIRPNGAPFAKYSQDKATSQVEVENSQKLLDLYSANGDVTELGFGGGAKSQQYKLPNSNAQARVVSVTPAPQYADYVDEQTKSRRVAFSKPLYTVQQVEVREHNHRLVEDADNDSVQPSVSEFEKLRLVGTSSYGKSSSSASRRADNNREAEYVTPVPQEYGHLRAGAPVPDNLQQ